MQAGRLDKRLAIQTYSVAQDPDSGELTKTWATSVTRWGSIEELAGREGFQDAQVTPETSHKMHIRHGTTVSPRDRITWNGRTFEIEAVLQGRVRNVDQVVLCKEVP